MLSLRRQIQHWQFSILIIAMYWNLQGIQLQISGDTGRISKVVGQSGQIKYIGGAIIIEWKNRTIRVTKRGKASAAKCCQLKSNKKDTTIVHLNLKIMTSSMNREKASATRCTKYKKVKHDKVKTVIND